MNRRADLRKLWLREEQKDVRDAACYAMRTAMRELRPRLVIPGDKVSLALGLLLHPVIRQRLPKPVATWLVHQVPTGLSPQIALVVPVPFAHHVIEALMLPDVPEPLHHWVVEQIDQLGMDELSRHRIRQAMGVDPLIGAHMIKEARK